MSKILLIFCCLLVISPAGWALQAQDDPMVVAVKDNNAFAFDLYQQIAGVNDGNFVYSPLSVSLALAMTYDGALGTTAENMATTLHFSLDKAELNQALAMLTAELLKNGNSQDGDIGPERQLSIANSLWGEQAFPFKPDFVAELQSTYGAGLELVDFIQAAEDARQMINTWVEDHTNGLIKDIVPPGAVDAMTRLVLVNAIYFKSNWMNAFNPVLTQDQTFTLLDDSTVDVPMMHLQERLLYAAGENYQAISLPYGGGLAMEIYLPNPGEFEAFEASFTPDMLLMLRNSATFEDVLLTLPKWKTEADIPLSELLAGMGMASAFAPDADFTGMFDTTQTNENLFISAVLHKAFISVDENGTEAAAATAIVMRATSAMPNPARPVNFVADHPYIYTIVDQNTGSVLFMGRVMNPSVE
ncbi:MAG: serpin family protein [Anaerolineaceae bacterium]|nr:serpin family protein [Anaerolineaceae bacterium]